MNLIDTNGITHVLKNRLNLKEDYYLAPDVVDEVELAQLVHGGRVPRTVRNLADHDTFDKVVYLDQYQRILNTQGGKSFYNMTGFGDVSIIAGIHAIAATTSGRQGRLFSGTEPIIVYTDDGPLGRRINQEFTGKDVKTLPIADIA
jgi:hypothetical protein